MKTVIFLALLCTVYASLDQYAIDSQTLQQLVNTENTVIQTILNGLSFFDQRMWQDLEVHFEKIQKHALNNINNIINGALEDVNRSIHNAKKEGKNDTYYYYAKNNLESKRTNAVAELEMCIQNGITAMQDPLENVFTHSQAMIQLKADLNGIIPNCDSTSFLTKKACVLENLDKIRQILEYDIRNCGRTVFIVSGTYMKTLVNVKSCVVKNTAEIYFQHEYR